MIIDLVNAFDNEQKYKSIYSINTKNKGVVGARLTTRTNAPHELVLEFSPALPGEAYRLIKDSDYGIRLKKENVDLIFIPDIGSKGINSRGFMSVRYFSSMYKMKTMKKRNVFRYDPKIFASQILNLIDDSDIILYSPNFETNFDFGARDGLDILNEVMKLSKGWRYTEVGMVEKGGQLVTRIIVGDPKELDNYAAQDALFKREQISNKLNLVSVFNDTPVIDDLSIKFAGKKFKYLFVALDTGGGVSARNASPLFSKTNYDFVDPNYPIVEIDGLFYIQDIAYTGIEERFGNYFVTLSSNVDDGANNITTVDQALEYAYNKAVTYMKEEEISEDLDLKLIHRKIALPKNYDIQYKKVIKQQGRKVTLFDISGKYFIDNITIDLARL